MSMFIFTAIEKLYCFDDQMVTKCFPTTTPTVHMYSILHILDRIVTKLEFSAHFVYKHTWHSEFLLILFSNGKSTSTKSCFWESYCYLNYWPEEEIYINMCYSNERKNIKWHKFETTFKLNENYLILWHVYITCSHRSCTFRIWALVDF